MTIRESLYLPSEKGRENGALAVNFLTPGGSVVLRNHDMHFAKGSNRDFLLSGLYINSRFCCGPSPDHKGHPFAYVKKLSTPLIPTTVWSKET
jgi:hypothetical protein